MKKTETIVLSILDLSFHLCLEPSHLWLTCQIKCYTATKNKVSTYWIFNSWTRLEYFCKRTWPTSTRSLDIIRYLFKKWKAYSVYLFGPIWFRIFNWNQIPHAYFSSKLFCVTFFLWRASYNYTNNLCNCFFVITFQDTLEWNWKVFM